ncbi:hypothetical protein OC842_007534 [Tilletia horrida]|uniref:Uncharacterized protein n=1 Tax=Tilletia horrida TaxID=155126 RepID=A0AAN6G3Q6_9BASI|nr:hypothetical protein OC842_007534 [Tilletia horrida]
METLLLPLAASAPVAPVPVEAVWTSLAADNQLSVPMTEEQARLHEDVVDVPLLMTPAKHLLQLAHGSTDLAVAKESSSLVWKSVQHSSRAAYGRDVIAYLVWCEEVGVPIHFRFPAARNYLVFYLIRDMSKLRPATIENRFNALMFWHHVQRMPWALDKAEAKALRKAARVEGLPPLEPRRPVRLNDLMAIVQHHKPSDAAHVAVVAAAFLAFFAMCRPGELTTAVAKRPHKNRSRWTDWVEDPTSAGSGIASFSLRLRSDKTHGKAGFNRMAAEQRRIPELCPVRAVRRHLAVNAPAAGEDPEQCGAFSYLS